MMTTQTGLIKATSNILRSEGTGPTTASSVTSQTHHFEAATSVPQFVPAQIAISSLISQDHEPQRLHLSSTRTIQSSPQPLISVGASLDTHLPQSVKDKFMKGEYVDLLTLLQSSTTVSET